MTVLQFQPLRSQPTPEFWTSLSTLKLDKLGLDDSVIPIHAWIEEGRQVSTTSQSKIDGSGPAAVGVDGSMVLSSTAFDSPSTAPTPFATLMKGYFKNFNTIEEFRSPGAKKAVFDHVVQTMLQSFETPTPQLNVFVLFAFADLKKYTYHYWFAFPSAVSKPSWNLERAFEPAEPDVVDNIRSLITSMGNNATVPPVYLLKRSRGQYEIASINDATSFFRETTVKERIVCFADTSSLPDNPGWLLRNALYYLNSRHSITDINVICLRQGDASRFARVTVPPGDSPPVSQPQMVGWERDGLGKLSSRVANLGPMLDPTRLAEQAVDLNLKLMRWRIMPQLELDKVSSTKCLLLGAGTLGCYVARTLMGWGIREITLVDSARVSFSNPVRQPLFQFEDCLNGGKAKAECAAERLKQVFPTIHATGHSFMIPMPGHPISASSEAAVAESVERLEQLISSHDAIFLLMDSRESRWLPTLLGALHDKVVVNAALGFDSFLVMRHGAGPSVEAGRLGCYFCNDIVAPADSLTDRTLDQMCTVTRPGVAPIASACAVEMMVSLVQHPLGLRAPAERPGSDEPSSPSAGSPLGPIPHQIRGMLNQWNNTLIEGRAFDSCTGCSAKVIGAYKKDGFAFLLRVFNETGYLESVTGLDKLYADAEAALDSVDWEEGSDSSGEL